MSRIYHLSFLLDTVGNNRTDLITFGTLYELDTFIIKNFKNTRDVRRKYDQKIGELCIDNMEMIKEENKRNKRSWLGSVVILAEEYDQSGKIISLHKVPIIYQNDRKLLPRENCLEIIKEKIKDKNIVARLLAEKSYLLSDYERHLLIRDYNRTDNTYFKSFVGNFYNRLKRSDDEILYYYCRSLMHLFALNQLTIQTAFGKVEDINEEIPEETTLTKPTGFSKDAYFNELINDDNYDELFNLYSVDEIVRDSDLFEGRSQK